MITVQYKEMPEPLYEGNEITIIYMWHPPLYHSILPHWHSRTELILVLEGNLNATCGSYTGVIKQGDTFVVNPHQLHAATAGEVGVKYYAVILEERLSNGLRVKIGNQYGSLFPSKYRFTNHIKDKRITELLLRIIEEDKRRDSSYELFVQASIIEIFALLQRHYIDTTSAGSYSNPDIFKMLTYIDEHYADKITTENIAKTLGYNKSHFCRKFKQYTGTSFVKYLTTLRLEKAISIIQSTNKPISEIANEVGFETPNYFTRMVVRYYGKSPIDFRKEAKMK